MTTTDATTATDEEFFAYHRAALDGLDPPMVDGKPQGGTYRMRRVKNGPWLPVMIDRDNGRIVIEIDGQTVSESEHARVWSYCAKNPVEPEDLFYRLDHGAWPGEEAPPAAGSQPGHNIADVDLLTQLTDKIESALTWLQSIGTVSNRQHLEAIANRIGSLREAKGKAEKAKEAEVGPLYRTYKAALDKYTRALNSAESAIKTLRKAGEDYVNAERQREIAAAEEARRAAEADAARRAPASPNPTPEPTNVVPMTPPPPVKQSFGGVVGRKISTRPKRVAVVTDQDAVYQFHRADPDVVALLKKLAQRCVDADVTCPGVTIEEQVKLG
jgi:hypothetical protein